MSSSGLSFQGITGVAISNVVPYIGGTLERFAKTVCEGPRLIVGSETDAGITLGYNTPQEVGPDRIVNAVAASHYYGVPAIVVDYGTATTFDAISEDGIYLGGAIAPGIGISVEALAKHAARLSRIELLPPVAAIGRSTVESMRSGIVLGFVDQTDGMIRRFRQELGGAPAVIATGGLAEMIASQSVEIRHVDPWLTLEGLRLLWQRNRK
jgi:type III pantothenate kinase